MLLLEESSMRRSTLMGQRLVAVFLAGCFLYYSPVISLLDRPLELLGLPVLYLYLFGVWVVLIGLMAWIVEGSEQ